MTRHWRTRAAYQPVGEQRRLRWPWRPFWTAFAVGFLFTVFFLGGCQLLEPQSETETIVYVERACSAYDSALATLVPYKPKLSDATVRAVIAMNTQADAWCLPGAPVPQNAYDAIARLAEMSARLATFLGEVK